MSEPSCVISGPIEIVEEGPIQIKATVGHRGWGVALEIGKSSLVMDANEAFHLSTALRKAAEEAVLGGASCQSSEHAGPETASNDEQRD